MGTELTSRVEPQMAGQADEPDELRSRSGDATHLDPSAGTSGGHLEPSEQIDGRQGTLAVGRPARRRQSAPGATEITDDQVDHDPCELRVGVHPPTDAAQHPQSSVDVDVAAQEQPLVVPHSPHT